MRYQLSSAKKGGSYQAEPKMSCRHGHSLLTKISNELKAFVRPFAFVSSSLPLTGFRMHRGPSVTKLTGTVPTVNRKQKKSGRISATWFCGIGFQLRHYWLELCPQFVESKVMSGLYLLHYLASRPSRLK